MQRSSFYSEVPTLSFSVSNMSSAKRHQLCIYSVPLFPSGSLVPWAGLAGADQRDVYLTLQGDNPTSSVVHTIQPLPVWVPPTLTERRGFRGWVCRAQLNVIATASSVWIVSVYYWDYLPPQVRY